MAVKARFAVPAILLLVIVLCAVLAVVGVSLIPLVATAALGWGIVVAGRWGVGLGLAVSVLGAGGLVLAEMILFAAVGVPLLVASLLLWIVVALGAVWSLVRCVALPSRAEVRAAALAWGPPLLGPAIWAATMLATVVFPAASRYSWVMMGDSANNILFARQTTYDDGIHLGGGENPVPLPAALIALAMSAGRLAIPAAELLRHDIAAFAVVWGILIALTSYIAGAAAAVAVDRSRAWMVIIAGAGASLLPLSWFVTGYPLEYGFFNAHVALPIVFASWIVANVAGRNPALALSLLLVGCTLMLAVWSPLVLVPLALGIVVAVRYRGQLFALRGRQLLVPGIAVIQLGAFGLAGTLPSLLVQGGYLTSVGGVIPFPRTFIIVAVIGSAVVVGLAFWRKRTVPAVALAAVVVAGGLGIGALLFLSRNQPSPWTYYPTKLAWLMTIVFGVLALGTLIGVLPRARVLVLGACTATIVLGSVSALYYAAMSIPYYQWSDPVPRVLADNFVIDDDVAERIFALSDPDNPHLLWKSGDPNEGSINFWLLQMRADSVKEHTDLRISAYGHGDSVADLCAIAAAMGGRVTVVSKDPTLSESVSQACPGSAIVQRTAAE